MLTRHVFAGPFVTSVGGTTSYDPEEIGASISQGGFSLIFGRESYQEAAVTPFLGQLGNLYPGLYKWARCRNLTHLHLFLHCNLQP